MTMMKPYSVGGSDSLIDRLIQAFFEDDDAAGDASQEAAPIPCDHRAHTASYNPEHVHLIEDTARAFARHSHTPTDHPSRLAFSTLVNVLFDRYFLSMHSLPPGSPPIEPAPLLDCLFCLAEASESCYQALRINVPALHFFYSLLQGVANETTIKVDDEVEGHPVSKFIAQYQLELQAAWQWDKDTRLGRTTHCLMPWSVRSRLEGIPSPPTSYDYDAIPVSCPEEGGVQYWFETPSARHDNRLYFSDMVWLGGYHDGYCRSTTLSAYVWIRFSAVTAMRTRKEHLALWQSALSFGVLEAITGKKIPESILLSTQPDGTSILTSDRVSMLILRWLYAVSESDEHISFLHQRVERVRDTVTAALLAINEAVSQHQGGRGIMVDTGLSTYELYDITTGLTSLLELFIPLLQFVIRRMIQPGPAPFSGSAFLSAMYHALQTNQRKIAANGWCPFTFSVLQNNVLVRTYASVTLPFFRSAANEHAPCTATRCLAHNLDSAVYETQHAPSCSGGPLCTILSPSLEHVSNLLSSYNVPVILYDGRSLTVRNAADGPYVAISHVWADGLGSTTEAGLPICQISRIAAFSRQLVPDGAFWVDSLCVPDMKQLRKRAILLMAETYRYADEVVVFDAGVRTLCNSTTPLKEIIFRITTSPWMQRVWTLQEAMLARELHFEFADGLFPITRLQDALKHCKELVPSSLGLIPRDLFMHLFLPSSLRLMVNRGRRRPQRSYSLPEIVGLLRSRTTSKQEDETIAISGLLRIDTAPLLAESDADTRMIAFFLELKTFPANIIFNPAPKLQHPGFRWAPRTLASIDALVQGQEGIAHCSPAGLTTEQEFTLVMLPSVQVSSSDTDPDAIILVNPTNEVIYLFSGLRAKADQQTLVMNGLVATPSDFEVEALTEGSSFVTMGVHIATPPDHPCSPDASAEEPVVCECLFYIGLHQIRSRLGSLYGDRDVEDVAALFKAPVLEGKFISTRVTMT